MAWCRPGDKPLSEPMMVRLLTHICVTRPQWVKAVAWYSHQAMIVSNKQVMTKSFFSKLIKTYSPIASLWGWDMVCLWKIRNSDLWFIFSLLCCNLPCWLTLDFDIMRPKNIMETNFESVISEHMLRINFMSTSCEIALWQMQRNNLSTLIQVMAWCHQTTSHCLSQRWPRSISPYGITRPQWVNLNPEM